MRGYVCDLWALVCQCLGACLFHTRLRDWTPRVFLRAQFESTVVACCLVQAATMDIAEEKQEALIKFLEALEASEDVDAVYHDA